MAPCPGQCRPTNVETVGPGLPVPSPRLCRLHEFTSCHPPVPTVTPPPAKLPFPAPGVQWGILYRPRTWWAPSLLVPFPSRPGRVCLIQQLPRTFHLSTPYLLTGMTGTAKGLALCGTHRVLSVGSNYYSCHLSPSPNVSEHRLCTGLCSNSCGCGKPCPRKAHPGTVGFVVECGCIWQVSQ
jgi:hypothetical protein